MSKNDENAPAPKSAMLDAQAGNSLLTVSKTEDVRGGKPSASGMQRLALCPGSWQAEAKCPPSEDSPDANMGTRLHKCMETG